MSFTSHDRPLIADSFAGGGGASKGIQWAIGRSPDIAVNHSPAAIMMHAANHPDTVHYCEDVYKVDPAVACMGRKVALFHMSPDCTHFSKARGSKPVSRKIRGLAWVGLRWARAVRPEVIVLENVFEFTTWGPTIPKGGDPAVRVPCPVRKGRTFNYWVARLRDLGYEVEWRKLNAADFGAPTARKRLVLVARCDGLPIAWPTPTHGPGRPLPYRTAAECIDWSVPSKSIFLSPAAAKKHRCKRPLAANTQARIGAGFRRFVVDRPRPYIVAVNHGGDHFRGRDVEHPLGTVTGSRGYALATPYLTPRFGEAPGQAPRAHDLGEPLPTATCREGGGMNLVTPYVARLGQTGGNGDYVNSADSPTTTITGKAEHMVVAPHLLKFYTRGAHAELGAPHPTLLGENHSAVVAANLVHMNFGDVTSSPPTKPLRVICAKGNHHYVSTSLLVKYNGTNVRGQAADEPLGTITTTDRFAMVDAPLCRLDSIPAGCSARQLDRVARFLRKYAGLEPAPGAAELPGTWVAVVPVDGMPHVVADIGLRMLTPRELYNCQGFPPDYVIDMSVPDDAGGFKPMPTDAQVSMVGNSVPPPLERAVVAANVPRSLLAEVAAYHASRAVNE